MQILLTVLGSVALFLAGVITGMLLAAWLTKLRAKRQKTVHKAHKNNMGITLTKCGVPLPLPLNHSESWRWSSVNCVPCLKLRGTISAGDVASFGSTARPLINET